MSEPEKVPFRDAAAQAVSEVQQDVGADAGASLAQMSADPAAPLPAEAEHDAMMAEFKAMSERLQALEAEASRNKQAYQAAVAALGPPPVATYGRAIFDKLVSFRAAHPDLGDHFNQVIDTARTLGTASQAVLDGGGDVASVLRDGRDVVDAVDRFITKTHPRLSGKPIDFSALASDLEYFVAEAGKIPA
jgi:hypothetical protein